MTSKLDRLREMTVVVADTGDIAAVRRLNPQDCTTNPTLLLKAAGDPASAPLVDEAIAWGRSLSGPIEARAEAVCDRLAVSFGAELAGIVPGRVSTEVDADLSFDTQATLAKARAIIAAYEARGIGRERILIKIAATWEGIRAAEILQKEGIDCNLTLLFSLVQAAACADAGVFLISPFVGRILDWYRKETGKDYNAEEDPGVQSVISIYNYYKHFGYKTEVMGASFRNVGEIIALAGCDLLTISPDLLAKLRESEEPVERRLSPEAAASKPLQRLELDEKTFRWHLNEDPMATDKLADGIRRFAADTEALADIIEREIID